MKKVVYILFSFTLFFASCEKQVIKPISKNDVSESVVNTSILDAFNDTQDRHDDSSVTEEKSGIIDPNGRDDVGGKSPKKTK